jgi:hypothetical protein
MQADRTWQMATASLRERSVQAQKKGPVRSKVQVLSAQIAETLVHFVVVQYAYKSAH